MSSYDGRVSPDLSLLIAGLEKGISNNHDIIH